MTWVYAPALASDLTPDARAFAYGDGVFTTAAVVGRRILLAERHWARLETGAERLALSYPGHQRIRDLAAAALAGSDAADGMLKMVLSRDGQRRGYAPEPDAGSVSAARFFPAGVRERWQDLSPLKARAAPFALAQQPALAGVKHLNRLEQVLVTRHLGPDEEVVCYTADGVLVSAGSANLFFVTHGTVHTPALLQAGIAGVTRAAVLALARQFKLDVSEGEFHADDIAAADEVFLTSSRYGLRPLSVHANAPRSVGPVSRQLHEQLLDEVGLCVE